MRQAPWSSILFIFDYCCMRVRRVLLYAKMLKEAENKETRLFCQIFVIGGIFIEGEGPPGPPPWLRLCWMVRSSEIRKSLNIEPFLLSTARLQLRWFGHVSRMPQERLSKQALLAKANERRPVGRPTTRWTDIFKDL